jgi:transposase-like protein
VGDQYIYLAMEGTAKAILSWLVGKRNYRNTQRFVDDVRHRVLNSPEISTDGSIPYQKAVNYAFDIEAVHGIVDKQTVIIAGDGDEDGYYAKEQLVKVERTPISGNP